MSWLGLFLCFQDALDVFVVVRMFVFRGRPSSGGAGKFIRVALVLRCLHFAFSVLSVFCWPARLVTEGHGRTEAFSVRGWNCNCTWIQFATLRICHSSRGRTFGSVYCHGHISVLDQWCVVVKASAGEVAILLRTSGGVEQPWTARDEKIRRNPIFGGCFVAVGVLFFVSFWFLFRLRCLPSFRLFHLFLSYM